MPRLVPISAPCCVVRQFLITCLVSTKQENGTMSHPRGRTGLIATLVLVLSILPASAQKKAHKSAPNTPSSVEPADQPQPEHEALNLDMYQRIREEGIKNSRVMEYASGLMDGIGARLTGSPNMHRANEWTRDQLTAMGCVNAHLEDWGEFGMGWQQINTWVRMAAPDSQVMIAQAAPWSPATNGAVQGAAIYVDIQKEEDIAKYKARRKDCPAREDACSPAGQQSSF
jgi:hypothetical protein